MTLHGHNVKGLNEATSNFIDPEVTNLLSHTDVWNYTSAIITTFKDEPYKLIDALYQNRAEIENYG